MPVDKYRGISIREEVYYSILEFIKQHPEMGYRNVAQFATDAMREKLLELKTQIATAAQPPAAVQEGVR